MKRSTGRPGAGTECLPHRCAGAPGTGTICPLHKDSCMLQTCYILHPIPYTLHRACVCALPAIHGALAS
jgi:hypothetical protein